MTDSETLFWSGCCQVCGEPLREPHRWREYCSPKCRLVKLDFEECVELEFILNTSRWSGGAGWQTLEERMAEAVRQLSRSADPLAEVLIEIVEILDRDQDQW